MTTTVRLQHKRNGAIVATTTDALTYSVSGTYTIVWKYTDAVGNVSQQNQVVTVTCSTTGLDKVTANSTFIYPNPASDFITIEAADMKTGKIFNVNGQEVMNFKTISNTTKIEVAHLPKGLYYVQFVSENNEVSTQKLILQ